MKRTTGFVLLVALVGLLAYDLFAVLHGGYQDSLSVFIRNLSHDFPLIPFLAGVVVGHLWFGVKK